MIGPREHDVAPKARHDDPAPKARHDDPAPKARHDDPAPKARHDDPAPKARHDCVDPTHAIPPTPAAALRAAAEVGAGLEELGGADLRLPQLKLKQPWTWFADRVPEGSWFITSDPEGHALSRGLVLLDARTEGGRSYRLLVWDLAAELVCAFFARGAATGPTRELLTQLWVDCQRFSLPAWGFVIGLSAARTRGLEGGWFVPVWARPMVTTRPEQIPRWAAVRDACAGVLDVEDEP